MPDLTLSNVELQTKRLLLRLSGLEYAAVLLPYYHANSDHLKPWEPLRPDNFYTPKKLTPSLIDRVQQMEAGNAICWLLLCRKSGELKGECNFTNIIRGSFQACYLGFSIAQGGQGKGLMHEALSTQ
ncbi:MAG: hypothetical protein AB2989_03185 [Candidatus Symbiodolus clandestinus]